MKVSFDAMWIVLAAQGKCDSIGGQEYLRVAREWANTVPPEVRTQRALRMFIIARANVNAHGQPTLEAVRKRLIQLESN